MNNFIKFLYCWIVDLTLIWHVLSWLQDLCKKHNSTQIYDFNFMKEIIKYSYFWLWTGISVSKNYHFLLIDPKLFSKVVFYEKIFIEP